MIAAKVEGVEFIAANTDVQALTTSQAPVKLQLGVKLTSGLARARIPTLAGVQLLRIRTRSSRRSRAQTWSLSQLAWVEEREREQPR